jgi:hypothetical protein
VGDLPGLLLHQLFQVVLGDRREVVGEVPPGGGVELCPHVLEAIHDRDAVDELGAEGEVLDEVREPLLPLGILNAADVERGDHRHHRGAVVLLDQHAHPALQREVHLRELVGLGHGLVRQLGRGAAEQVTSGEERGQTPCLHGRNIPLTGPLAQRINSR